MRTSLLAILLLASQDPGEVDRAIRALGSSIPETREKAEEALARWEEKALPALRKAVEEATPELSLRAKAVIGTIERLVAERQHDARERAARLSASDYAADQKDPKYAGAVWKDGVRLQFSASPIGGGTVVSSYPRNYLTTPLRLGSDLVWDLAEVHDSAGREATLERCAYCSPRNIFAKGVQGPLKVHLKGVFTWFSPYDLRFPAPKDGDRLKVGDLTVEVAWPKLKIASPKPLPKEIVEQIASHFTYKVHPGVIGWGEEMGGPMAVGGSGGGGRYGRGKGWCFCSEGPHPMSEAQKIETVREVLLNHTGKYNHTLDQVTSISCSLNKPVQETLDVTVEVAPR